MSVPVALGGICAALCAAPAALCAGPAVIVCACPLGTCTAPAGLLAAFVAIEAAIVATCGTSLTTVCTTLIPVFGTGVVYYILDCIVGCIFGSDGNDSTNNSNNTTRKYNGTYSITDNILKHVLNETQCDYNNIEQLLSQHLNSSSFSIPLLNTSTASSPQERALLWLKSQNKAEVERCDPYSTLQRYILALLYYGTNGVEWIQQGNFLSNENVCSWKGVFCDNDYSIAKKLVLGKKIFD